MAGLNLEVNSCWTARLGTRAGFKVQRSEYHGPQTWGDPDLGIRIGIILH